MRVSKFLIAKNIGLKSFHLLCDFLHFERLSLNSKIPEFNIHLLEEALNDKVFVEWLKLKSKILFLEKSYILSFVISYFRESKHENDSDTAEILINYLTFLKDDDRILSKVKLNEILTKKESSNTKIKEIRMLNLFTDKKTSEEEIENFMKKVDEKKSYKSEFNPFQNFYWGGLSGEEAVDGYWNTD